MIDTAVVVAAGDRISPAVLDELPREVWVVAADGGLDNARRIGLHVDLLVGDLDSVGDAALDAHTGPVERHPEDKDRTDLELALAAVAERPNIDRIVVLGGRGGRIDHLLANAAVLTAPHLANCDIEWIADGMRTTVVRTHASLHGTPGELVSLLAVGGPAEGIHTRGLRWELSGGRLEPWSARGVSNRFTTPVASVRVASGVLMAIQPQAIPPA